MVIAYLRVSTEKQFLANQKEEILRFAEKNGLSIDKWYTETVDSEWECKYKRTEIGTVAETDETRRYSHRDGNFEAEQDATGNHDNSEFVHQKTGGAV